jgi:hypothetical protein
MSYDLRFMLVALAALAALFWATAALRRWLLRQPRTGTAILAAVAYAVVAAVVLGIGEAPPRKYRAWDAPIVRFNGWGARLSGYRAAEHDRVDSLRIAITPALERYRKAHGQYPVALEDAGIATPQTAYGPLHYYGSRSETPHWYLISFGNPKEHGFEADWDSRTGKWQVFEFDL